MRGFAQAFLIGNLTAAPELKTVRDNKVANFRVAVNRKWKDANGELQEDVDFISVVAWNKLAENVAQYCDKGSPVFVAGRLEEDRWEKDGDKRSKIQVVARDITFLPRAARNEPEETDDDAPFK